MDAQQQPLTGNSTFDHILAIVGALVPLFSALSSFLNHKVRTARAEGEDPSAKFLKAVALMNVLAVNLDKARQLSKLARGENAPTTEQKDGDTNGQA